MTPPSDGTRTSGRTGSNAQDQQGGQGRQLSGGQGPQSGGGQPQAGAGDQPNGGQGQQAGAAGGQQEGAAGWFASAALRTGIVVAGFVLFLFALGQAVGFNLLDLFITAVTSPTGRWIVVAIFALLLIAAAGKGLNRPLLGG